eukprot:g6773.t1
MKAGLAASCLMASLHLRVAAFAPPPTSFFIISPSTVASARWHTSSLSRPSSGDSNSGSSSSDFSFNDLERELRRRRAEEALGARRREAEQAGANTAAAAAAATVAALSSPGSEEWDAFMEQQMALRKSLLKAHVLIFNQGQTEEGIYTLFFEGRNILRAWQDKAEAARYALMLRAEDLPLGKPTELTMAEIIDFCKRNGAGLELIASGRVLQPPSINVKFDFDPSSSSPQGQDGSSSRRPGAARPDDSLFTPQELARIKKQFEKSLEGSGEVADGSTGES